MTPSGYLRYTILPQLEAYSDEGVPRVLGTFARIGDEAEEYADRTYRSYSDRAASDEGDDYADLLEESHNQGIQYFEVLNDLRQAITNLLAAGLYHLFEQHLSKLKHLLSMRGQSLPSMELAPTWPVVEELRLLANTVKHAAGSSANRLRARRPELFVHPSTRDTQLESMVIRHRTTENPLGGTDLFVRLSDLERFRDAVRDLWVWMETRI